MPITINQNKSFITREILAGITTFFTMAYIIVVNPIILAPTGMDLGALFVATCLSAAIGCFLMGSIANYPLALAPTMGMNAYFAYVITQEGAVTWQMGLGAVFIAGILFTLLTFTGIRQWLIRAMPKTLKIAIAVGIGLFLAMIALKSLGFIATQTFDIKLFMQWPFWLCIIGLTLMIILNQLRIMGAILIGMAVITLLSVLLGLNNVTAFVDIPPSLTPTLFQLQIPNLLSSSNWIIIFTFLFVTILDNTGTTIAVLHEAKMLNNQYESRLGRALFTDGIATTAGSLLGTSPTGSYVESVAGTKAGGRTGITSITVGVLFLAALFFAPLAKAVPSYAAAAALLFVAITMMKNLSLIVWRDFSESVPALLVFITIPLTFSIATGISVAFISYVITKCLFGKAREIPIGIWLVALICAGITGYKIKSFCFWHT